MTEQLSWPPPRHQLLQTTFDDIVIQHEAYVYRVCLRVLSEEHAAHDAAQETFLAAWRNRSTLELGSARAWLSCVAFNKSLDELRRRSRRGQSLEASIEAGVPEPAARERSPDFPVLNAELRSELQDALVQLPHDLRMPVMLHDVEGLTYPEIASAMSVPLGTVKSRIFRARMALRALLTNPHCREPVGGALPL